MPVGAPSATSGTRARRGERLLVEKREDPRDRRGLARPGSARHHREAPHHRDDRRQALKGIRVASEKSCNPVFQHFEVDVARRRVGACQKVRSHLTFVGPVPVQIQGRPFQPQGPVFADESAGSEQSGPSPRIRPREVVEGNRYLRIGVGRPADRLQIHARVPEAWGAHRQRGTEKDHVLVHGVFVRSPKQSETARHVDVRRDDHPCLVEGAQQSRRTACKLDSPTPRRRIAESCHFCDPLSKRSLSSSIIAAGGHHDHTPQGWPSAVGNIGLLMPRRNRYRTPAKSLATS